ncbi:hypothetical protein DASC09_029310 [Saccharomycopsis crataegensis]|uniref:Calcineurin-like phosphoesterase domain-containing protein n=1 Tax=Saccharomycopsis crataegensis TaxID=43959 RepID=A0AAV5QLN6_9ASCO|nr:hypothetical protein DASC09_029310 [Saccharomycopsis crataegensis]
MIPLLFYISLLPSLLLALPVQYNYELDIPLPDFFKVPQIPLNSEDVQLVSQYVDELSAITNSTTISKCNRCINELNIAKSIALSKNYLVPPVFTQWCKRNKIMSNINCEMTYGRVTVNASTSGGDFGNLMTLMEPEEIDGQYYCYYKRSSACPLPDTMDFDIDEWVTTPKPQNAVEPPTSGETFNVLHISDHHLELAYQSAAESNCTDAGMCCTSHNYNDEQIPQEFYDTYIQNNYSSVYENSYYAENGTFIKGAPITEKNMSTWQPATSFGTYYCDSPETLVNSSLKSVNDFQKEHNISFDFAIFTGDLVDHLETQYSSFSYIVEEEERMLRDMKHWFGDIPVYSSMGNHDTYPYGQIAQEASGFDNKYTWNSDLMAHLWSDFGWIDNQTAQEVRSHYCGFSVKAKQGLRIISINSNTYYQKNLYSYWNMTNPDTFGTLRWLASELSMAEQAGERVWIMSHIPFNDYDALPIPAKIYSKLVARFSPHVIAGIFFGHTHIDQFSVLYASDGKELGDETAFAWVSQSVSPIWYHNPGWRWYEIDAKTYSVMNSHNYYSQLADTLNNDGAEPQWDHLYDARETYDLDGTWPSDAPLNATFWGKVAHAVRDDNSTAQMFGIYSVRDSPENPDCSKGDCADFWCYASSFTRVEYDACMKSS